MGRSQQITLAAARAAHEARRSIAMATGGCAVPAYEQLDQEARNSVNAHTAGVLAGDLPMVDDCDSVCAIVSDAILAEDAAKEAASETPPTEPRFEAPVPIPTETIKALETTQAEAQSMSMSVRLMDDTGTMVDVKELP